MNNMYSLVQSLNDSYYDLRFYLNSLSKVITNQVEVETIYENEDGKCQGTMYCIDEDGINELKKIYDGLEKIIGG